MSLFLDPKSILSTNNSLSYIEYNKINENQKEFLRTDLWDFSFTIPPAAVYFPGNEFLKTRLISVSPSFPGSIGEISAKIRGFDILQKVGVNSSGSVSLTFMDREDQSVSAFKRDWQEKITSMDNKFTYRKEDTVAECVLRMYNSTRTEITQWTLHTCQLDDGVISRSFTSDDPSNNGEIEMTLKFEHMFMEFKNIQ